MNINGSPAPVDHRGQMLDEARFGLFLGHIEQVEKMASIMHAKMPEGALIDREDLTSVGLCALWKVSESFDPSRGEFWTYASIRVKGSMLDECRRFDHLSRLTRDTVKAVIEKKLAMEQAQERAVSFAEAAKQTGLSQDEVSEFENLSGVKFVSFDAPPSSNGSEEYDSSLADAIPDPHAEEASFYSFLDRGNDSDAIEEALSSLTGTQRAIVRLYFFSGIRLKDIGSSMGLTESRVSQYLSESFEKMKARLRLRLPDVDSST